MLSAVKLCQSSSISGPVATEKPRSAKISANSSITWLTGWTLPFGAWGHGEGEIEPLRTRKLRHPAPRLPARPCARLERIGHAACAAPGSRGASDLALLRRLILPSVFMRRAQPALLAQRLDPDRFDRDRIDAAELFEGFGDLVFVFLSSSPVPGWRQRKSATPGPGMALTIFTTCRRFRRAERPSPGLMIALECSAFLVHGEIGHHLAVQLDAGKLGAMHELRIGQTFHRRARRR